MNDHLITTTVEGKKALRIFETFETDRSLPKHKDAAQGEVTLNQETAFVTGSVFNTPIIGWSGANNVVSISSQSTSSFFRSLWAFLTKRRTALIEYYHNKTSLSVTKTFEAIMGGGKKLVNLTNRLDDYSKSIEYAKSMGQVALAEQLTARLPIIQAEAILVSAGFTFVIDEDQLIEFALKCEKGLVLDWVKNFTRLIPHSAQIKKIRLDELRVFDNYVILHFDPTKKASALTKKEVEKKKDPILFGVIKDSRRLYKIADWKDEFCDLTFDQLIAEHGKEALTLK